MKIVDHRSSRWMAKRLLNETISLLPQPDWPCYMRVVKASWWFQEKDFNTKGTAGTPKQSQRTKVNPMVGTWFQEFPWTKNKEVYDLQSGHAGFREGILRSWTTKNGVRRWGPFSGRAFPQTHSDQWSVGSKIPSPCDTYPKTIMIYSTSRWNPSSSVHWYTVHRYTQALAPGPAQLHQRRYAPERCLFVRFPFVSLHLPGPATTVLIKGVFCWADAWADLRSEKKWGFWTQPWREWNSQKFVFGRLFFCSRATFHQKPHSTNDCSSQKGVEKRCDCITKIGQVMFPRIQTLEAWNLNIQGCQVAKNKCSVSCMSSKVVCSSTPFPPLLICHTFPPAFKLLRDGRPALPS